MVGGLLVLPPSSRRTIRSEAVFNWLTSSSLSPSTVWATTSKRHSTRPASTSCSLITSAHRHTHTGPVTEQPRLRTVLTTTATVF